jgi:hypothetical protein
MPWIRRKRTQITRMRLLHPCSHHHLGDVDALPVNVRSLIGDALESGCSIRGSPVNGQRPSGRSPRCIAFQHYSAEDFSVELLTSQQLTSRCSSRTPPQEPRRSIPQMRFNGPADGARRVLNQGHHSDIKGPVEAGRLRHTPPSDRDTPIHQTVLPEYSRQLSRTTTKR